MKELEEKDLEDIKVMASAFMHPVKIARCIGIKFEDFKEMLMNEEHPASIAFYTGYLKSEHELNEKIIKLAKQGSSPAQTLSVDLLSDFKVNLSNHNIE